MFQCYIGFRSNIKTRNFDNNDGCENALCAWAESSIPNYQGRGILCRNLIVPLHIMDSFIFLFLDSLYGLGEAENRASPSAQPVSSANSHGSLLGARHFHSY